MQADIAANKTVEAEPFIKGAVDHDCAGEKYRQLPVTIDRGAVGKKNQRSQNIGIDDNNRVYETGNAAALKIPDKIQGFLFKPGKGNTFAVNKKWRSYI